LITSYSSFEDCLHALYLHFKKTGNSTLAEGMAVYMKSQFVYFGIPAPVRKKIFVEYKPALISFIKQGQLEPIILLMWEYDEREWQYCAVELLLACKKYWTAGTIELIERLILSKSWWDTVDHLGGKISGLFFKQFPRERETRINSWIHHPKMWLNRSAIIHQLTYKEKTKVDLLLACITPHVHSKEFFHRKAIGWALRQYSRTDPKKVIDIVNSIPLSPLSKKEALRLIQSSKV
jgi:3-methyladenine DNA glycosylase AlkD